MSSKIASVLKEIIEERKWKLSQINEKGWFKIIDKLSKKARIDDISNLKPNLNEFIDSLDKQTFQSKEDKTAFLSQIYKSPFSNEKSQLQQGGIMITLEELRKKLGIFLYLFVAYMALTEDPIFTNYLAEPPLTHFDENIPLNSEHPIMVRMRTNNERLIKWSMKKWFAFTLFNILWNFGYEHYIRYLIPIPRSDALVLNNGDIIIIAEASHIPIAKVEEINDEYNTMLHAIQTNEDSMSVRAERLNTVDRGFIGFEDFEEDFDFDFEIEGVEDLDIGGFQLKSKKPKSKKSRKQTKSKKSRKQTKSKKSRKHV
jgi:hypothetical protein